MTIGKSLERAANRILLKDRAAGNPGAVDPFLREPRRSVVKYSSTYQLEGLLGERAVFHEERALAPLRLGDFPSVPSVMRVEKDPEAKEAIKHSGNNSSTYMIDVKPYSLKSLEV